MNLIFEPSLLFISQSDWLDDDKKDAFLECLLQYLEYLDTYDICKIIWADELENLLWNVPQMNPWLQDTWGRNPSIQIIAQKLNSRAISATFIDAMPCVTAPDFAHKIMLNEAHELFLKCAETLLVFETNFRLGVSPPNKLPNNQSYTFTSANTGHTYTPELINQPIDLLHKVDILDFYPKNIADFDTLFDKGLQLILLRDYPENTEFLYNYNFSKNFKKEIIEEQDKNLQVLIFEQIVQKLILSPANAGKSKSLQDEYISTTQQYRFRVSQVARIHYLLNDKNIEFINYYGAGKHDVGL
jgi:hypothetical protein